jgi:hypothetical protein
MPVSKKQQQEMLTDLQARFNSALKKLQREEMAVMQQYNEKKLQLLRQSLAATQQPSTNTNQIDK